eukprot:6844837-Heterocapsa_arctica.AAC.1
MTISHNGVIACEEVVTFYFIDFIFIRAASRATWLLYDSLLVNHPVHAVGTPSWDDGDMTYGQQQAARELHKTYASEEGLWPCNTMPCQSCFYLMPA